MNLFNILTNQYLSLFVLIPITIFLMWFVFEKDRKPKKKVKK